MKAKTKSAIELGLIFCCSRLIPLASAQVITATIRGTVKDQQGGDMPDATIAARQVETNTLNSAVTSTLGRYYLPSLPAGTDEVQAVISGFAHSVLRVYLTVGAAVTLEFAWKVGGFETQIMVTGEAPLIESTRNVVGLPIRKDQIDRLPTLNRDFIALALLAPGVSIDVDGKVAAT